VQRLSDRSSSVKENSNKSCVPYITERCSATWYLVDIFVSNTDTTFLYTEFNGKFTGIWIGLGEAMKMDHQISPILTSSTVWGAGFLFGSIEEMYVYTFTNDLVVYSRTFEENLRHLVEVLRRLGTRIALNCAKVHLAKVNIKFRDILSAQNINRYYLKEKR
jgi:hypothetical protein